MDRVGGCGVWRMLWALSVLVIQRRWSCCFGTPKSTNMGIVSVLLHLIWCIWSTHLMLQVNKWWNDLQTLAKKHICFVLIVITDLDRGTFTKMTLRKWRQVTKTCRDGEKLFGKLEGKKEVENEEKEVQYDTWTMMESGQENRDWLMSRDFC